MAKKKLSKKTIAAKNKGKKKKGAKKKQSFYAFSFKWVMVLGLWLCIFLAGVILWFAKDLPDITSSATFERRASIVLKASNGSIISRYGENKEDNLHVADLPPHLIHAVLATEDRRFYDHPGLDILGIARAMAINIYHGRFVQGGSTITQQLTKNLFLSHDRKISRKIREAILSIWLERELTKDEILSAYMNRVYLGSGTYGFDAASHLYFNKSARDVNLREATILAGLLKAPSRYSPHNNPTLAQKRGDVVLEAMRDARYITRSEQKHAKETHLLLSHKPSTYNHARYFTNWVIDGLDDLIGAPDMDLIVETTLDQNIQNRSHENLNKYISENEEEYAISQGGVLVMRPDGAILSMIGGKDYSLSQFNRATQAKRPSGSAFKPFIYLTALSKGWKSNDLILDAPINEGEYRPKNFANKYYGKVSLEMALSKSMNTATVRLAQKIGIGPILATAKNLGIFSKIERDWSIVLGSSGTSMLEMTTAYAALANGGLQIFPYAILRITNKDGYILYERKAPKKYQRVARAKDISKITKMMQNVIEQGTGRAAKLPFPAAGKTGTSQGNRDAWFIGYSDNIVASIWLGNDDNSPMNNITGGGLPALIWRDIMIQSHGRYTKNAMQGNQNKSGISGLLGRLLTPSTNTQRDNKEKPPFSNLND